MKIEEFKTWMKEFCDFNDTTINNRISNCRKVESCYGDLEDLYCKDGCTKIITALTYSTKDEKENLPPKHIIPIDGNIRNGSATLKSAVKLYVEFEEDFSAKEEKENELIDEMFVEEVEDKIEDKSDMKNGFNSLFDLINTSEDEFIRFFIKNTLFISPEYVENQVQELHQQIENGEKIPVRFSLKMKEHFKATGKYVSTIKNRKDAVNISREFDIYSKRRSGVKVKFDSTGNKSVVDAIEKYTKCRVSTSQSHIINYSISHVWAQTFDPFFFSSLWNIVLVPSYLNPIMDKPKHQQKLNGEIQGLIKAICNELYNPNELLNDSLIEMESAVICKKAKEIIAEGLINYIDLN